LAILLFLNLVKVHGLAINVNKKVKGDYNT